MNIKIPIYLSALIKKYPTILSGRKKTKESSIRIIKTKKLIKDFILKKSKP